MTVGKLAHTCFFIASTVALLCGSAGAQQRAQALLLRQHCINYPNVCAQEARDQNQMRLEMLERLARAQWGEPLEGLQLGISIEDPVDQQPMFRVFVRNVSNRTIDTKVVSLFYSRLLISSLDGNSRLRAPARVVQFNGSQCSSDPCHVLHLTSGQGDVALTDTAANLGLTAGHRYRLELQHHRAPFVGGYVHASHSLPTLQSGLLDVAL